MFTKKIKITFYIASIERGKNRIGIIAQMYNTFFSVNYGTSMIEAAFPSRA